MRDPTRVKMPIRALAVISCVGWMTLASVQSAAAMEVRSSIAEINQVADLAFVGTVTDIGSRFNEQETMIFTDVTFGEVVVVHRQGGRGQLDPATVKLTYAGGQVGSVGVSVSGAPRFEIGQRYLVFMLDPDTTYANPVVGGAQGELRVIRDTETGEEYVLSLSGKAVLGLERGELVLSRERVERISGARMVVSEPAGGASQLDQAPLPTAADPGQAVTAGPRTPASSEVEAPMSLARLITQLRAMRSQGAPTNGVFRFGDGGGRFFAERNGKIIERELPEITAEALLHNAARGAQGTAEALEATDSTPRWRSADDNAVTGGSLGYCGYYDLHLAMEQVSTSWWEWGVNNSAMYDWNQGMDVFRYVDDDGTFGNNSENEFCGYVSDGTLNSVYGFHWGSGIAMCITWTYCQCCEIHQADILWNSAYSWTNNWEYSIGNGSVVYLATVDMHELGHSWGMQRDLYVETYDYDQPSVMHSYYHNLVETGRGFHRPDAYCMRRLYDDQTSILGTKDIGVESYWASNGLHNAYLSSTTVHPGDSVTINGITVENISYSAVGDLRVRFFLSSNRTITTSDTQMGGYWYWTSFGGEQYNVGNYTVPVPTVPPGQYYVGAMVTMNGWGSDDYTANNTSSLFSNVTVLPAAPSSLSATDGTYDDRIRVSWASVSGATSYEVRRCYTSACTSYAVLGTTSSTYYDYPASSPKCIYYFKVVAKSSWGNSYPSAVDSGWKDFEVPTGFYATDNQPSRVRVAWSSVPGASSYAVWRGGCTGPLCLYANVGNTSATYYDDYTATPGLQYYYFMRPSNSCGTGPASSTNAGSIALPAPTGVIASDGAWADRVRVTWASVANAASYDVWRGLSPSSMTLIVNTVSTTFDDFTAAYGTTYYYRIAGRSSIGAGALSSADSGYRITALVFQDGFESGNWIMWSGHVP